MMTTAEILTECLRARGGDTVTLTADTDSVQIVAGRPGSVCFTLQREVSPGVRFTLAEGFTLDGVVHYTQRALPEGRIADIIACLAEGAASPRPRPTGTDLLEATGGL
ncbi:hypothetical protein [Sphaerobacter thermophilus]|uniref:hypothetical protein n=1 Tax=Sphaerobacter thermophilus TaxID=2057 RepID=UPI0039C2772A